MGDRRSIVLEYADGRAIAFYSHWTGSDLERVLANALQRAKSRWDDPAYLARVIFCEMVKDAVNGTSGFGIEPASWGDNDYCEADSSWDLYVVLNEQRVANVGGDEGTWYSFEWLVKNRAVL